MIKVDLHNHTCYSSDSVAQLEAVAQACVDAGVNVLAITDHNTIAGALALRYVASFPIIVGAEIYTREGEIIGLFLEQEIPRGLTPEETIARIREQGGLVVVPHPFDRFRRARLNPRALERVVDQIDAVEVFNAHTTLPSDNRRAVDFAIAHGLAQTAGSDAHAPMEIGRAYVEFEQPPVLEPCAFLEQLRRGRIVGRGSRPTVHVHTVLSRLRKRLTSLR